MIPSARPERLPKVEELDGPSQICRLEFFEIEGRAVGIARPGAEGFAWVWAEDRWRWAPALANKDGVRLTGTKLSAEFPDASMQAIIQLASEVI